MVCMRNRLSRERRSVFPRPSDGRGARREGKDRLSRERRSWNMSRIRGKDTTPEKRVRSLLHRLGCRFRLNVKIPVGKTLNKTADEHGWTRMPNRPRRKVPLRIPGQHADYTKTFFRVRVGDFLASMRAYS